MPLATEDVGQTTRAHRTLAPQRAWLAARDERTLETQVAIARIAAPTGDEGTRAAWIAERFGELGLAARIDDAGNVIARRGGISDHLAPVVICSHLDTVFPRATSLDITRHGTRLAGPGIGDNCRGLAVLLALAELIDGHHLATKHPVEFVATTGEEGIGDLRGAKHYFAHASERAHAAIMVDGAGDDRIVHRALGSRRYRVTFSGPGGHSWAAFGIVNPAHAAGNAIARLAALPLTDDPKTTLTVARIGGGISINAIPESAWLEIDVRSVAQQSLVHLDAAIRALCATAEHEENARREEGTPALTHEIALIGDRPSGALRDDHPLVLSAMEATRLIGREPELATASTDANVPISMGIPAIAIGGGGKGGDTHTLGEWYDNVDGALGIGRVLTIVMAAAGLT